MIKTRTFTLVTALLTFSLAACGPSARVKKLMENAKATFGSLPVMMPGAEKDTPEKKALGEKLYHDVRLSKNDSQSCSSCHLVKENRFGVDNLPTSKGAFGKNGDRNAPTVLNAGFHLAQFWDGRAKDLTEQAKGPILNPVEMAMPSEAAVIQKISAFAEYKQMFSKAFPADKNPITYQNLAEAIAAFERTLITRDRFDDFVAGDAQALSEAEVDGLELFFAKGCLACHSGPAFGGSMYQKLGLVKPYETKDLGRFNVTKNASDKYFFKVPSLRNVAKTGPYFHDGTVATLEDAVKKMAFHQLGQDLSPDEIGKITAFLGSLTDKARTGK